MNWPYLPSTLPEGFAHRGGTDVAPGNTLEAFAHAVHLGYQYLETDVWLTTDGELVVFHDPTLDATTDGTGPIESCSWDDLSRVRVQGTHPIPRLAEVVEAFPGIRLNIEPKHDAAVEPLADFLLRHDLVDRVAIGSFADQRIARIRALVGPRLCTSPGPRGIARTMVQAFLPTWMPGRASGYGALQIPVSYKGLTLVTPGLVRRFHQLGVQVHVWTINEEAEMRRLLDMGVDVIMTDRPELLRQVLDDYRSSPGA